MREGGGVEILDLSLAVLAGFSGICKRMSWLEASTERPKHTCWRHARLVQSLYGSAFRGDGVGLERARTLQEFDYCIRACHWQN